MDRIFTEYDRYLFASGDHCCLHQKLGSHITEENGVKGTRFAVWAPNARSVSVIGAFNGWNKDAHHLAEESGIWEVFIPGVDHGTLYKYHIVSKNNNHKGDKGDPFAHYWENATNAGTYVWDLDYQWDDKNWMRTRKRRNSLASPISVYEVHLGSWQRVAGESNRFLSYREMACKLVEYVKSMGFTHVEFMPVMAHPFYGSWGYQVVGYFAATCRYGTPQDLMYLIDMFHQNGIGVILDWVPSHFPSDGHGLAYFDGTALYEHPDPRRGFNPEWKSCVFNYGRKEVCSFLMSSAVFWFEEFHIDGMRVDAVSSMLYLDYQRKPGQWIPNQYGGRENLDAIAFLKKLNETIYKRFPSVQMIAEEATSWPMVSRPVFSGGLGFGMKWDMGWMNDSLSYFQKHPNTRKNFHNKLTFSIWYAFTENFMLPLSHDEVVHCKRSLLEKMPGDDWQKFANLRLLFAFMYMHPGKKLIFMGGELAQRVEWKHEGSLDWNLLEYPNHKGIQRLVRELNVLYKKEKALYELDFSNEGFQWLDCNDRERSVLTFIRKGRTTPDVFMIACNFQPVVRENYRVGVPLDGVWKEVLNTDALEYCGSGKGNCGERTAQSQGWFGQPFSLFITLPPLGVVIFKKKISVKRKAKA